MGQVQVMSPSTPLFCEKNDSKPKTCSERNYLNALKTVGMWDPVVALHVLNHLPVAPTKISCWLRAFKRFRPTSLLSDIIFLLPRGVSKSYMLISITIKQPRQSASCVGVTLFENFAQNCVCFPDYCYKALSSFTYPGMILTAWQFVLKNGVVTITKHKNVSIPCISWPCAFFFAGIRAQQGNQQKLPISVVVLFNKRLSQSDFELTFQYVPWSIEWEPQRCFSSDFFLSQIFIAFWECGTNGHAPTMRHGECRMHSVSTRLIDWDAFYHSANMR